MRANSPPTARPVATAAMALVAAVLVPLAIPSTALAERWLRPVPGEVARSFQYARETPFTAGAHRGVDLVAPPGTAARAACGGRVIHAGPVAGHGGVVSVRCGFHRVSYMPLAPMTVHAGDAVRRGAPIGIVQAGHAGLHLGVRRESDPFGYEDPMRLLEPPASPPVAVVPGMPRPRDTSPRRVAPRGSIPRLMAPRPMIPRAVPAVNAPQRTSNQPPRSESASAQWALHRPNAAAHANPPPWPVWAGLGLLLAGAAGSGTMKVRRRRLDRRRLSEAHATT